MIALRSAFRCRKPMNPPDHTMKPTTTATLIYVGLMLALQGCGGGSTGTSQTGTSQISAETVSCAAPLVTIQTGSSSSCTGGNIHAWPVGLQATDCHGWRGVDNLGDEHDNSANNIRCNGDGSFSFDQHAGTLSCNNPNPVTKTFRSDGQCKQDIPPSLYSIPLDLSCCTAPGSAACTTGTPSVGGGLSSSIYLNSKTCAL
jgi:hypothetical protein